MSTTESPTPDAITMMEKYYQSVHVENEMTPEKQKKKKHLSINFLSKRKELAEVTNTTGNPTLDSPSKGKQKKSKRESDISAIREESTHIFNSLVSPTKEILFSKKKKELHKEVVLLTERVNALESTQVDMSSTISQLSSKLTEMTKERDEFKAQCDQLQQEMIPLKEDANRRKNANFKTFLSANLYSPSKPAWGMYTVTSSEEF